MVASDDQRSAFRSVKNNPNVVTAHAFMWACYLFLAVAQVFGARSSPPNYEPIVRARCIVAAFFYVHRHDIPEYREYLNHVRFSQEPLDPGEIVPAIADSLNPRVISPDGT